MTLLVLGALVSFIVTVIVTESYLFAPVRRGAHRVSRHLGVLASCFLCAGTWIGWGTALLLELTDNWFLDGLMYHGLAYLLWCLRCLVDDIRVHLQR